MRILLGHPSGHQFFRHLAAALHRHGQLERVASCVNWNPRDRAWINRSVPARFTGELARRSFHEPWAAGMRTHPWRETVRLVAQRLGWQSLTAHETGWCSVDAVYRDFDRWLAVQLVGWRQELGGVYAYEDGALATFTRAKELGMARIYDLPIAYWQTGRRLMTEEAARLPQWAETLGGGVKDSPAKLAHKTRELELAELVVTPSQFVASSLPDWARAGKRVIVSHFGSPTVLTSELRAESLELRAKRAAARQPLRVLFAGSMGQRKGLGDLFTAMRLLKRTDVELVVMGSLQAPIEFYRRECRDFIYEPGRAHAQVLELMRSCDVLCLPSIVEGYALVMQEAMSQGLPLIITPNTGGADLVETRSDRLEVSVERREIADKTFGRSETGFLVPIRSPEKIAEAIAWCADNRVETVEMGRAAQVKAATFTWDIYGDKIVEAIRGLERR